ncbi:MAG: sulfate ABC transporter permease subunit CysT, partial [Paracoccus sp. (in: a-proteobacteria)]
MATRAPLIQRTAMPGLGLSAGITLFMLSLVVILPVGALLAKGASFGAAGIWDVVNRPRVWSALWLSFRLSFLAALFNLVFGVILAWVLVRYRFPGKRLLDAAVDLPFALPTAVAGIALTALYAPNGALGSLAAEIGWKIAYTQWGIFLALVFVGLPFVTRTVQPVIEEIETEVEEASATLGASRLHTLRHVIAPMLMPAALTGFALSLARAVGEYG